MLRKFELHRDADATGVSGTGVVADGVVFEHPVTVKYDDGYEVTLPSGWVRLVWRGPDSSTVHWPDLDTAMRVHGHNGLTRVVWINDGGVGS